MRRLSSGKDKLHFRGLKGICSRTKTNANANSQSKLGSVTFALYITPCSVTRIKHLGNENIRTWGQLPCKRIHFISIGLSILTRNCFITHTKRIIKCVFSVEQYALG